MLMNKQNAKSPWTYIRENIGGVKLEANVTGIKKLAIH